MLLDYLIFLICELARLVYYCVRNTYLSDIMQKSHHVYIVQL